MPKSPGSTLICRRSSARMVSLVMGSSYVLPVRLSVMLSESRLIGFVSPLVLAWPSLSPPCTPKRPPNLHQLARSRKVDSAVFSKTISVFSLWHGTKTSLEHARASNCHSRPKHRRFGRRSMIRLIRSADRYHIENEWLSAYWHFSFDHYHEPANISFGPLRVFNNDTIAPGGGFPFHSHHEMEIVTYLIKGQLEHHDTLGNHGVISPGEVQRMSAGTGIRHSEFNPSSAEATQLVQLC